MQKLLLAVTLSAALLWELSSAESAFGQAQDASLAESVSQEEKLLVSLSTITSDDVTRMEDLVVKIKAANDSRLLSRAELILALFRQNEISKGKTAAYDADIREEADAIRRFQQHKTKDVLMKGSLWLGLSSLAVAGVSQAVMGWASDQYSQKSTAAEATPYFIAGQISQIGSLAGFIGGATGIGLSWLLAVDPFDIPAPLTVASPATFPRAGMSTSEKISYLKGVRAEYGKKEAGAIGFRDFSVGLLATGAVGALAAGVCAYLSSTDLTNAQSATSAAAAAAYRQSSTIYQYVTIGAASLALVGIGGGTLGYLFGPDPTPLTYSVRILDSQLDKLNDQQ